MSTTVRSAFTVQKRSPRRVVASLAHEKKPRPSGPSRAARMLALAHHVERLVEAGELSGYAEAARSLGLTRARLTQVMALLLLAPDLQERILQGDTGSTERSLRRATSEANWRNQLDDFAPSEQGHGA